MSQTPSRKFYKTALVALMAVLLVGAGFAQNRLNRARKQMGLTRVEPLENAPPMLAFTTVALGGFRGLIANALWIRMVDLQDEDKFFEMVQLADWITKLQPHLTSVWIFQAWNMAYNISVKFKDAPDRWRWVKAGIELLRDQALKYNPKEPLLYRELAGFFFHKIGQDLDDAHKYYKQQWIGSMMDVLGSGRPKWDELVHPQTADAEKRVELLKNQYKLNPREMKRVDEVYGPLDWRMPETHAIYWAMLGMELSKPDDLMPLRRMVYQAMQLAFQRGRLVTDASRRVFMFAPNLDIVGKVNQSYEDMLQQDEKMRDNIMNAHKNFLKDAVYFFYEHDRRGEAAKWFKYLCDKYPTKPLLYADANSLPGTLTLDEYAIRRVTEDFSETSNPRTTAGVEGLLEQYYINLALGQDTEAANYFLFARRVYQNFEKRIPEISQGRVGLPKFDEINREVRTRILSPDQRLLPAELLNQLRTQLGVAAPTNAPPAPVQPQK